MSGEVILTVVGTLGGDPELRFTPNGVAVCNFSVATNERKFDKRTNEWVDGDTTWFRVNAWRQLAENCAETLTRGMRVIIQGRFKARQFETREGEKRIAVEIEADAVGPDLKWATAKVNKVERDKGWNGSSSSSAEEYGDSGGNRGRSSGGQQRGNQASRGQAGGQRRQEPAEDPWGSAPPVDRNQAADEPLWGGDQEPPF